MANNQYVNKVVFGNTTVMDISDTTATADKVLKDEYFYLRTGEKVQGTCEYDSDTTDADATAAEILLNKTAYVNKNKITGQMPNRGAVTGNITTKAQQFAIQNGYHDGSGYVEIDSTEQAKIIANNIKDGVTILGVLGTYTGEGVTAQTKSATPYTTAQTILPDAGYDYLAEVDIAAISYTETPNAQGGLTVTIGAVAPSP